MVGKRLEGVGDLKGELACRSKDERLRVAQRRIDLAKDRQCERGGLTGTGLGQPHDVAALHEKRNRLRLDRRRLLVADLLHRCDNGIGQVQLLEPILGLLGFRLISLGSVVGLGLIPRLSLGDLLGLSGVCRRFFGVCVLSYGGFGCGRSAGVLRISRIPGVCCSLILRCCDNLRGVLIFRQFHVRLKLAAGSVFGSAHCCPTLRETRRYYYSAVATWGPCHQHRLQRD